MAEPIIPALSCTYVKPLARIRRERILPARGEVLATIDSRVDPLDMVARTNGMAHLRPAPVARYLRLSEKSLSKYLLKKPGDEVSAREIIASRPEFFGSLQRIYRAPGAGRIAAVQGSWLTIDLAEPPVELKALYRGTVVSVTPRFGIVIEAVGTLVQGAWGGGGEGYGVLRRIVDTRDALVAEDKINAAARGSILLGGTGITDGAIRHAVREHAAGLITGSLSLAQKDLVAGLGLPTLMTEGWGEHAMCAPVFDLLSEHVGEETSLNTLVSLQGGARPEVFIPAIATGSVGLAAEEPTPPPAQIGATVRILGGARAHEVGTIKTVNPLPQWLESGMAAWGGEIEITAGETVFVPWENVELIG